MEKTKIFVMIGLSAVIIWAATPDYLPLTKGNTWHYMIKVIPSACPNWIDNGNCGAVNDTTAGDVIIIDSLSLLSNSLQCASISDLAYNFKTKVINGAVTNYLWFKKNDSLFSGYLHTHPDSIMKHARDISTRNPGDTIIFRDTSFFVNYNPSLVGDTVTMPGSNVKVVYTGISEIIVDTLFVRQNQTITVPAGTFNCRVTEFHSKYSGASLGYFSVKNGFTYKADSVGIIKELQLPDSPTGSALEFILHDFTIVPTVKLNDSFKPDQNSQYAQTNFTPEQLCKKASFVYNVQGKKLSTSKWNLLAKGVYFAQVAYGKTLNGIRKIIVN